MKYTDILSAPAEYWDLTPEEKSEICNGVGPRGFGFLIPDTIYGLRVTEAADIHDYMYHVGTESEEKTEADEMFLDNLIRIIEKETWFNWLKKLRCHRAKLMYAAIVYFGGPAFLNKR